MKKRNVWMMMPVLLLLAVFCVSSPVFAEDTEVTALTLKTYSVAFDLSGTTYYDISRFVEIAEGSDQIKIAETSNDKVCGVDFYDDFIYLIPAGAGSCTITVTGKEGDTKTIAVTVTEAYMKEDFKYSIFYYNAWYGSKKIYIYAPVGTGGTLKVGKDSYKFSVPVSGVKKIKLKKLYKLNTKIKITAKKGSYKAVVKGKMESFTLAVKIKGSGKTVKVKAYNVHKGDIVKIKYKGKVYKKTIKKNKDGSNAVLKFKVKNKVAKAARIKVAIYNKDKKKLSKQTEVLKKGVWDFFTLH